MRHIHKEEEFKFRGSTYLIGGKGEGSPNSGGGGNSYLIVLKKLAIG